MHNLINKKTKLFYSILILCFFLLGVGFAGQNISAQKPLEVVYPGNNAPITTDTPLPDYVKYIYIMAVTIVGLIMLGVLIRAGYIYMTSTGAPAAREDAKKRIIAAFLGAIILLSSSLILYTLNPQLVMMNIGRPEKVPTSTPPIVSVSTTTEKTFTFFQIPVGKIIERAILDDSAQSTFNAAISTASDIEKKSETLKNLAQYLKTLTDACQCNQSSCSSIDGGSGAGCDSQGCPAAVCDKNAIEKKVEDVKTAITDLQNAQKNLAAPNTFMTDNLLEIKKAGILMSLLGDGIEDYNSMLTDRHFLEENNFKVTFDYFSTWQDIKVRGNNVTVNDPATLYFEKKGNEDAIAFAREFEIISSPSEQELSNLGISFPSMPSADLLKVPPGVLEIPFYSQRDPRWATQLMGGSSCFWFGARCTMGNLGCLLTSIASSLTYMGFNRTPLDVFNSANSLNLINPQAYLSTKTYLDYLSKTLGFSYKKIYDVSEMGQKPLITYCKTFKYQWGHFITVKGIKDGRVYINDPYFYITSLSLDEYKNYNCGYYYYAFWK